MFAAIGTVLVLAAIVVIVLSRRTRVRPAARMGGGVDSDATPSNDTPEVQ